jgi:hypothetical protein
MSQVLAERAHPLSGHEVDLFIVTDADHAVCFVDTTEHGARGYAETMGQFRPAMIEKATVVIGDTQTAVTADEIDRIATANAASQHRWYGDAPDFKLQLDEVHERIQTALTSEFLCDVSRYHGTQESRRSRAPTADELQSGVICVSKDILFSLADDGHCAAAATALEAFASELLQAAENLRQAE